MDEFVPFRFKVTLYSVNGTKSETLCSGMFSEVSGLEVSMEPKVIKEGGRNWGELQRTGPSKFSTIVLKRGVTDIDDLWEWMNGSTRGADYGYRLRGEIDVMGTGTISKGTVALRWILTNAMPVKFKGPDLSSTSSQVAIEELHLVHEGLELKYEKQVSGSGAKTGTS